MVDRMVIRDRRDMQYLFLYGDWICMGRALVVRAVSSRRRVEREKSEREGRRSNSRGGPQTVRKRGDKH